MPGTARAGWHIRCEEEEWLIGIPFVTIAEGAALRGRMKDLTYVPLDQADTEDLVSLMNRDRVKTHLVDYEPFDDQSIREWIASKLEVDRTPGCKVRGIVVGGQTAGWCGIQREAGEYELAIVIGEAHWGLGKRIFRDLMGWAREMGHREVLVHFLDTRREYAFLRDIATETYETELHGRTFRAYRLRVD